MRSLLKFRRRAHPGFALVVSLVLAVMIVLLAVALLGLSSVSLRTASAEALRAEARSNARLALMLALGELQRATGPDQRVTAPAAVRDDGLARPHLTGVWNSWKWDGQGSVPDFSARKTDDFLRWLVSSTDPAAVTAIDAPRTPAPGKTARLVAAGGPVDRVDAEIVPAGDHGGYAWAVFDESAKLPLSTPAPEPPDGMSGIIDHLTAAPRPGYAAVTERAWQPLEDLGADRAKLVTTGTSAFALEAAADRRFHDVTSASPAGASISTACRSPSGSIRTAGW